MAFSFSRLIISESDSDTCKESFRLIGEKHPEARRCGTASCVAEIDGYKIWLGFEKGVPAWKCSCAKDIYTKIIEPCAHEVALALIWDRSRGVPDPSQEDIMYLTRLH